MRGEHTSFMFSLRRISGSSPHARGALSPSAGRSPHRGIIPACAGSTTSCTGARVGSRDHPRMRGEHRMDMRASPSFMGSSPHARGALQVGSKLPAIVRIIPACAGSTRGEKSGSSNARDHPRMRGEHAVLPLWYAPLPGSSPHARGAPLLLPTVLAVYGIIPACAGSTPSLANDAVLN